MSIDLIDVDIYDAEAIALSVQTSQTAAAGILTSIIPIIIFWIWTSYLNFYEWRTTSELFEIYQYLLSDQC